MKRREFITLLGSAAAIRPLAARAQQTGEVRRIGVLNLFTETDPEPQTWDAAFRKRLDELGWIDGRNVRLDYRWGAGSVDRVKLLAAELVRLKPDVLVSITTPATAALQAETRTVPIVFAVVSDPVGSGFVESLARPGGNITGFINLEASLAGKQLRLMRDVAPRVTRVGILFNLQTAPYARYYLDAFRSATSALAIEAFEAPVRNSAELEAAMTKLGTDSSVGFLVMSDTSMSLYRQVIYSLADGYRLPVIYPFSFYVREGGLISYGIDLADTLRGAATYVDRILRGAKPNQLPVQQPTKFELVINLKTAKALGLDVSLHLQEIADEVIE
jgi:putative tryptophan/tyrosine transport system substrate-binding protein